MVKKKGISYFTIARTIYRTDSCWGGIDTIGDGAATARETAIGRLGTPTLSNDNRHQRKRFQHNSFAFNTKITDLILLHR